MILDFSRFEVAVKEAKARGHNYSGEMAEENIRSAIENTFDSAMAKCADYTIGSNILKDGGYFNVLGLGNWLTIAREVGLGIIDAAPLCAVSTMDMFAVCSGHDVGDRLDFLDKALLDIKDNELLRFDACAFSGLKATLSEGAEIDQSSKGWVRDENGKVNYMICDRLVNSFLWSPEPYMMVWSRPIVQIKKRSGWSVVTGAPGEWPKEWRVYINEGKIVGVSNYYLQSSADETDISTIKKIVANTELLISALNEAKAFPHHPRYEGARNTEKASFSVDWAELESGELVIVECGPDHLRNPNWGAHPCCFDHRKGVDGIALALGDVRPMSYLNG